MQDSLVMRARLLTVFLFAGLFCGAFFFANWIAPLYASAMFLVLASLVSIATWWTIRKSAEGDSWKPIAEGGVLFLVALGYHLVFSSLTNSPDFVSPLLVWNAPVVLMLAGVFAMLLGVVWSLREGAEEERLLLLPPIFGCMLGVLTFLVIPFDQLSRFSVAGYAGVGVISGVMSYLLCVIHDKDKAPGVVVRAMIWGVLLIATLAYTSLGFAYPPFPFLAAAYLVPAFVTDLLWATRPKLLMGAIAGFLYASFLYAFAADFTHSTSLLGGSSLWTALVSGTLGGAVGAFLSKLKLIPQERGVSQTVQLPLPVAEDSEEKEE